MNKHLLSLLLGALLVLPACCGKQKCQAPCETECDQTEQCVDAVSNKVEEVVERARKTDSITKF